MLLLHLVHGGPFSFSFNRLRFPVCILSPFCKFRKILSIFWLVVLTRCIVGGTSQHDRPSGSRSSADSECSSWKRARKEGGGFLDLNLPAEVMDRNWIQRLQTSYKYKVYSSNLRPCSSSWNLSCGLSTKIFALYP